MGQKKCVGYMLSRLFWKEARKGVEYLRFRGADIKHFESSGFLEREFTFQGDKEAVDSMIDFVRKLERL